MEEQGRQLRRTLRMAALATLAVAALAGCVRFSSDTGVHADDTFSQTAVIATNAAAREQLESFAPIDLGDLRGAIRSSQGYLALAAQYPDQIEVADYDDGELTGVEITATDLPLDAFENTFGQLTSQLPFTASASIVHTEETYVVSIPAGEASSALTKAGVTGGQLELLGTSVDVSMSFTFPGLITSATRGEVDGKTVTLGLADLAAGEDITIVAGAAEEMNWKPWLMWGGIALAALVIVGGAAALIAQDVRRHRANKLPPVNPQAGAATAGPGMIIIGDEATDEPPAPEASDEDKAP